MPDHDPRLDQLNRWLQGCLPDTFARLGWGPVPAGELQPASSDASFRRYFRWQGDGRSLVLMDAPPPQEDCRPFVRIAGLLAAGGVAVPRILAADVEQGFLLLDDLGRQTWLDVLDAENAEALFEQALQTLVRLQQIPTAGVLPAYDEAVLRRELQLFPDWYLQHERGQPLDARQQSLWQRSCDLLVANALAQPQLFVHRDYMPRNLMLSQPNPGVLDFQDALHGPLAYDVASLFKDAFISWPEPRVLGWQRRYWQLAGEAGVPVPARFEDFQRDCDLIGAQRHLKVIGIFARICHRDGKPRYLADVPRFFAYLETVLARRAELAPLAELLDSLGLRG